MLLLPLLGLLASRESQAFYNPSTGRWLSRDPGNSPDAAGFANARAFKGIIV